MEEKKSITIFFNKKERDRLNLNSYKTEFSNRINHDGKLREINHQFHLHIDFLDRCNFIVDYAFSGHVVFSETGSYKLLAIPEDLDSYQLEELQKLKVQESDLLYIYLVDQQGLEMIEKNKVFTTNQKMLKSVLDRKVKVKKYPL